MEAIVLILQIFFSQHVQFWKLGNITQTYLVHHFTKIPVPPCVLIWGRRASGRNTKIVLAQDQFNCEITSHVIEQVLILSSEVSVDFSKTTIISSFNHTSLAWSNRELVNPKLAVWSRRKRFFTTSRNVWWTWWMKTTSEYLIFFDDSIQTTVVNFHTKSLPMVWETCVRIWTSTYKNELNGFIHKQDKL